MQDHRRSAAQGAPRRPTASGLALRLALAYLVEREIEGGRLKSYAEAARRLGMTRARLLRIMSLVQLSPRLQEGILNDELALSNTSLRSAARSVLWQRPKA